MGLLSSIKNVAVKAVSVVKSIIGTSILPSVGISGVSAAKAVVKEPVKEITRAVAVSAAVSAAAAPAVAASVASKIIPKSTVGKVAAVALAVPAATAVVSNPSVISKVVGGVINVESNLIKTAASDKQNIGSNLKELVTENPIIVGSAVAAAAIFGVKSALPTITGLLTSEKIEEQTEAIEAQTAVIKEIGAGGAGGAGTTGSLVSEKAISTNEEMPLTTETTTIQTGKKKRRKAKAKQSMPSMKQSLNVLINNRNSTQRINKNYIKRELLYN